MMKRVFGVLLFLICMGVLTAQTITVTNPNGGEQWLPANTYTISWSSSGCGPFISIFLSGNDDYYIESQTANDGSYLWTIPGDIIPDDDYRILVRDLESNVNDYSDSYFEILEQEVVTVITPNGGEQWTPGSTYNIQWSSSGGSFVSIFLSGNDDQYIDSETANDGSFLWTISGDIIPDDDYRIKVRNLESNAYDYSDYYFDIIAGTLIDDDIVIPSTTKLVGNFPNPFNPTTTIQYDLNKSGFVQIEIFNVKGQKIKSLVNQNQTAGNQSVIWNGVNEKGVNVGSGLFLYKLVFNGNVLSMRKCIMLK